MSRKNNDEPKKWEIKQLERLLKKEEREEKKKQKLAEKERRKLERAEKKRLRIKKYNDIAKERRNAKKSELKKEESITIKSSKRGRPKTAYLDKALTEKFGEKIYKELNKDNYFTDLQDNVRFEGNLDDIKFYFKDSESNKQIQRLKQAVEKYNVENKFEYKYKNGDIIVSNFDIDDVYPLLLLGGNIEINEDYNLPNKIYFNDVRNRVFPYIDNFKFQRLHKKGDFMLKYNLNTVRYEKSWYENIYSIISEFHRLRKNMQNNFSDYKSNGKANISILIMTEKSEYHRLQLKEISLDEEDREIYEVIYDALNKYKISDVQIFFEKVEAYIPPAPIGGCLNDPHFHHDYKSGYIGQFKIYNPNSNNNNCAFYACKKPLKEMKNIKLTKGVINNLRKEYNIKPNTKVSTHDIKRIMMEKYDLNINIINEEGSTFLPDEYTDDIEYDATLMLVKEHYYLVEGVKKVCNLCGEMYLNHHDKGACQQRTLFKENNKKEHKFVILRKLRPIQYIKLEKEGTNEKHHTMHIDFETYGKVARPNVIGFCYYDINKKLVYGVKTGKHCVRELLLMLRQPEFNHIKWVNAFNGSRFDHNFLIAEELKLERTLKDISVLKTSSGIISGTIAKVKIGQKYNKKEDRMIPIYASKKIVDLSKHTSGSLKACLKAYGCEVSKGDFDHTKNNAWELLSEDVKTELLTYLEKDVIGLKELSEKIHDVYMEQFKTSWVHTLSTSMMAYKYFVSKCKVLSVETGETIKMKNKQGVEYDKILTENKLVLPTPRQYDFIKQAIYGGRCVLNKKLYISKEFDRINSLIVNPGQDLPSFNWLNLVNISKEDFNNITDYLVYLDATSLYPAAMKNFEYPIGMPFETKEYHPDKLGIYRVSYTSNKNILTPAIPRKDEHNALKWDLIDDDEQVYTNIDIENAKSRGYTFEIKDGLVWPEKTYLFSEYIEQMYKIKENAQKDTPLYNNGKLFMNALYGKMYQKPRYSKTFFVNVASDFNEIYTGYYITNIQEDGTGKYIQDEKDPNIIHYTGGFIVKADARDEEIRQNAISKPAQHGAFVLSYSRKIMLDFIKQLNPDETLEDMFYYTDTDSLITTYENSKRLDLSKKGLGYLKNELGDNCKILKAVFLAPKMYLLQYIKLNSDDTITYHEKITAKGVKHISDNLNSKDFETMLQGYTKTVVNRDVFRRFGYEKLSKPEKERGTTNFSVRIEDQTKVLNKTKYSGRNFLSEFNNMVSVPWGYEF